MTLRVLDLFCGAGGLSNGLEMSGYEVTAGIDLDPDAIQTFRSNFPKGLSIRKDLSSYHPRSLSREYGLQKGDFDVIVGGPPCQGFSISGPRRFSDPRNKLYLEFIEYVSYFKPKAFVAENVPGLVGLYRGEIKDKIIRTFQALGYEVSYKVLLASDYGVPQDRKRVFFIGIDGEFKFSFPDPTHLDVARTQKTLDGYSRLKVTVEEAIGDLPLLESELGQEVADYACPPQNDYQRYCRDGSKKLYNHVAAKHTQHTKSIISLVPEGGNYRSLPDELKTTRRFHIAWSRLDSKRPAPTVDTGHRHHFHPWVNRVPTVRECARFQSFRDKFIFLGPKTSQYVQVGNAAPPLLAMILGNQIKEALLRR